MAKSSTCKTVAGLGLAGLGRGLSRSGFCSLFAGLLIGLLLGLGSPANALDKLDDDSLADVAGSGIALGFDNFQFAMAPTSYFEQVGSTPSANCTGTGNVASNLNCWRRGDLRWYGINISGAAAGAGLGMQWDDLTGCDPGSLDCARGGVIANFSPFDNPYLIRAWSPQGMAYDGSCVNGSSGSCTASTTTKAIYEYLAPTNQPNYTFSWWGEIEAGSTRNSATQPLATGAGSVLKSQNIIRGNAAGSIFRLYQFTEPGNQTFGILYHSRLKGDYRFSVAQAPAGPGVSNVIGQSTLFAPTEGLYFRNVDAFLPLGQLFYQALTVKQVGTGGNFELALTPIPNNALVYAKHYGLNAGDTVGYETARANNTGAATTADYKLSHGYSRWGGWSSTGTVVGRNLINGTDGSSTGDGMMFRRCTGTGCANFLAFADRPIRIDTRGETQSMQQTQNYNCPTANAGGCAAAPTSGPTTTGAGDSTRTYPTAAVNIGDSRIEGLMFNSLRIESCAAGGC